MSACRYPWTLVISRRVSLYEHRVAPSSPPPPPPFAAAFEAKQVSGFLPPSFARQPFDSFCGPNDRHKSNAGCRPENASPAVTAATSPSSGEERNRDAPAGGESSPTTVAAAEAPSYRRLYDSAMQLLESELKLEPYPIPAGLEGNSAVVGKGRNQQVTSVSSRVGVWATGERRRPCRYPLRL